MSDRTLGVREFQQKLQEELHRITEEHGWNFDSEQERGYAFQVWMAEVFRLADHGLQTDVEDGVFFGTDLGADIILEDSDRKYLLVCQCKYAGLTKRGGRPQIDESKVDYFYSRHPFFKNFDWVERHGSEAVQLALSGFDEKLRDGYSVDYYFVTTAASAPRIEELRDTKQQEYAEQGESVVLHLLDFDNLKDFYSSALTLEQTVPQEVRIHLPVGHWFQLVEQPYPTIVAAIRGNALKNLYRKHKSSLFAWNIRNYLGNRGINRAIARTAKEEPEAFYYYNIGVSAICTRFTVERDNELVASDFQVINGAQTLGALANAPDNEHLWVLLRLTKTKDVKTEKGINSSIIRYNNTQNAVKISDFRSNDSIQEWLERQFALQKPSAILPKLRYVRKRSYKRGQGVVIRIEDLGKIRYSFLHGPTKVHAAPTDLWTHRQDGGVYEDAFGVEGNIPPTWSQKTFDETLTAIAFYLRSIQELKRERHVNPESLLSKTLRFHILALCADFCEERNLPLDALHKNGADFESVWAPIWDNARRILIAELRQSRKRNVSFYTFLKDEEQWREIREIFREFCGNVAIELSA